MIIPRPKKPEVLLSARETGIYCRENARFPVLIRRRHMISSKALHGARASQITEFLMMICSHALKEVVINGVRYKIAIRLDTNWSYGADWSEQDESVDHLDKIETPISCVDQTVVDAPFKKEPWLYAEIA